VKWDIMSKLIGQAVGDPPYYYEGGESIAVVFRTDAELLKSLLPPVLELPDGPARAVVRVVTQLRSSFGPYLGVYLSVPALFDGQPILFGLSGMKDSFAGTVAGREVWGMPLQVGEVTKEWHGDVLNVVAGRNGVDFVRLSIRLESHTDAPQSFGPTAYASRRQTFEKDSTEHVLVDVKRTSTGQDAVRHWKASATLKLVGGQPGDDWSILPVHEVLEARYASEGGTTLLHRGEVLAEW
jgi:hypothetical protein